MLCHRLAPQERSSPRVHLCPHTRQPRGTFIYFMGGAVRCPHRSYEMHCHCPATTTPGAHLTNCLLPSAIKINILSFIPGGTSFQHNPQNQWIGTGWIATLIKILRIGLVLIVVCRFHTRRPLGGTNCRSCGCVKEKQTTILFDF